MDAPWQRKTDGWLWSDILVFCAWVLLVSGLTLAPQPSRIQPPPSLCILCGEPDWGEVVANVLLFIPAGIIFARRGVSVVLGVAIGLALSAAIELAQLWVPGRHASLRDIVVNGAGVAVGALLHLRLGHWVSLQSRAMLAAALAVPFVVVSYTGWLFSSVTGGAAQYVVRASAQPVRPNWDAEFIDVTVGGQRMTAGQFHETDPMRRSRTAGEPILIRFVPKSPNSYLVAHVIVRDSAFGSFLQISSVGQHVFVQRLIRGANGRPRPVVSRFTGLNSGVPLTDTMSLAVRAGTSGPVCAQLSARTGDVSAGGATGVKAECALQPSLGAGWRLAFAWNSAPEGLKRALDGLAFAAFLTPVGLLAMWRGRWASAAFVMTTGGATSMVGHLVGLAWMGLPEVIAGLGVAILFSLLARQQSHPSAC